MFLDEAIITVRAGNGGDGRVNFHREKYIQRGGPDGGDGGWGGDVVLVADPGLTTLTDVSRRAVHAAENGKKGGGNNRTGRQGEDLVVAVPVGTMVREIVEGRPPREGDLLGELLAAGQRLIVARGGKGGRGNPHFATSVFQTPRFAEEGGKGEQRKVYLELKLLADVGVIGLPNAGKSTFLARVSAATPKIADYPFTTLHPNLGIADLGIARRLVIADIPGLIEGAHRGLGLGIEFLRHVERTRVLVHLVSAEGAIPADSAIRSVGSLLKNYQTIDEELARYGSGLSEKPTVVALSKIDLLPPGAAERVAGDLAEVIGKPVHPISAVTGAGLRELLLALEKEVRAARTIDAPPPAPAGR